MESVVITGGSIPRVSQAKRVAIGVMYFYMTGTSSLTHHSRTSR